MARGTITLFVFISVLLVALTVSLDSGVPPQRAPAPVAPVPVDEKACPGLCLVRCSKHSRPNHCNRVCQTCCRRCGCVPPGTAGNREMCGPCYANMTTHRNATKCP
ncbi:cypmaclein-like [Wolffia australiana]